MVSGCPSLIQVTLVAGEPLEVQINVEDEDPGMNIKHFGIFGGAGDWILCN